MPIIKLLVERGYDTKEKIDVFLDPSKEDYADPFLMKDMDKAVSRIIEALINREKVLIWGDYDVDGITSTSLFYLFLKRLGGNISYFIPDRELDGYGLSKNGIEKAKLDGVSLIITVDCGITSIEQAEFATEIGIDIVITDHHEPSEKIPNVYAVVDPKQKECKYPFKHFAGVGVAFKISQGILKKNELPLADMNDFLDLVAIGTAADIVPLIGENRKILYDGLRVINDSVNVGIGSLKRQLKLENRTITGSNIVFGMAPRLNAAGRMGDAKRAVRLLTSNNRNASEELVHILEIDNETRKKYDSHTLSEAINKIENEYHYNAENDMSIVVDNEEWHVGVIGIVASRLAERYHRPTAVISVTNGIGKGSCRSVTGINVYEILKECSDILIQFGGHEYAAGLEIEIAHIPEFRKRFNDVVKTQMNSKTLCPTINIDQKIDFSDINDKLISELKQFEPFGSQNKQPIFATEFVEAVGVIKKVGANHLKLSLRHNDRTFPAIGFNMADKIDLVKENADCISVAYFIEENTWTQTTYIQLRLIDIRI